VLCEAFGLGYSTLKYQRRQAKQIDPARIALQASIKACHRQSNGSAGARTLATMVSLQGMPLSRYRAGRLMKQLDLHSTQQCKHLYRKATQLHLAIDSTLDRKFTVGRPNEVWCSDVTYVWKGHRWSYLAVVLDLCARKPVGWALPLATKYESSRQLLSVNASMERFFRSIKGEWIPEIGLNRPGFRGGFNL
jgi:putative transposase